MGFGQGDGKVSQRKKPFLAVFHLERLFKFRPLTKQPGTTPADALRLFAYAFNAAGEFPTVFE